MGIKTIVRISQTAFDESVNAYLANGAKLVNSFITPTHQFVAILEGEDFSSELVAGEVKEVIKEVIKEVVKEVDNPVHLEEIEVLKDKLADALNAEQTAKKEATDLKKQIPKLQAQLAKLKKALTEE